MMARATWRLIENPSFTGLPRPLTAACHDGSPFLTIECSCTYRLHLHETQLTAGVADDAVTEVRDIATSCHHCGELLILPLADLQAAFAQMRADGWIE